MSKKKDEPELTEEEIAARRDRALKYLLNPNFAYQSPQKIREMAKLAEEMQKRKKQEEKD